MFADIGSNVKELITEQPNLKNKNKINIEDFAPRVPVVEIVSKKQQKLDRV